MLHILLKRKRRLGGFNMTAGEAVNFDTISVARTRNKQKIHCIPDQKHAK
jgi:hypothetical protein